MTVAEQNDAATALCNARRDRHYQELGTFDQPGVLELGWPPAALAPEGRGPA